MQARFRSAGERDEAQLASLNELWRVIIPANVFYAQRATKASIPRQFSSLDDFSTRVAVTTKLEIAQDQAEHPPYGQNLTFGLEHYSRLHQTSGTTGRPLRWLDTPATWDMLIGCWRQVYSAAGVTSKDVCYFAFSFGPFLGFWLAFDAANRLGCLCIPGGGLSSVARLRAIIELQATVLCCTPSYAMHLAEVAATEKIDLKQGRVRLIMVAGEAGGSIPATRAQIERLWPGARVSDHHGMTEVGAVSYECPARSCRLHVMDAAYLAEVVNPETLAAVPPGSAGELILTTLLRTGSPLLRYRTGDLVQLGVHHRTNSPCECGTFDTTLEGGILGRIDDMVVVRGVNVYPSAIEQIIREFPEVVEYRAHITYEGAMAEMRVVIEPRLEVENVSALAGGVAKALQSSLNLRIPVTASPPGSLARPELKAHRWLKS